MTFNEDTRVKIPAILTLTRLGYRYLSLKDREDIDPKTNIFKNIFFESLHKLNPNAEEEELNKCFNNIQAILDNDDLGKEFYNNLINSSGLKLIDWEHDKALGLTVNNKVCRKRPDYRSEKLKLIVEFDGIQHYTMPDRIKNDVLSTKFYESLGYKVVRIPYFIQLTNKAVKYFFNVDVKEPLFNENIHSMDKNDRNTPAFLCGAGVLRMIEEFKCHPEQYRLNKEFLISQNDPFLTGVDLI